MPFYYLFKSNMGILAYKAGDDLLICISILAVSIFMYLEMTFDMSFFINSINSGEQLTLSEINKIFKRSLAICRDVFLRNKCLMNLFSSLRFYEKYRLPLSKRILIFPYVRKVHPCPLFSRKYFDKKDRQV